MSTLAFVLLLTIPVAMIARRAPATALLVAVWAFALSLTSWGPGVHAAGTNAARAVLHLFGGA